jgi:hypothetical protein
MKPDEFDDDRIPGLERLDMQRAPERDLWPSIETRLRAPAQRRFLQRYAAAACLTASLGSLIALGVHREADRSSVRNASTPMREAELASLATPAALDMLPNDGRALVKANLKMVSDAEGQLRKALANDPDADYLRRLLSGAEARRLELSEMLASNS